MKQKLKGGDEFDCVSKWRKMGIITRKPGGWKSIKQKMSRRFRKEGRDETRCENVPLPFEEVGE